MFGKKKVEPTSEDVSTEKVETGFFSGLKSGFGKILKVGAIGVFGFAAARGVLDIGSDIAKYQSDKENDNKNQEDSKDAVIRTNVNNDRGSTVDTDLNISTDETSSEIENELD